jgi:hypothetical protein
MYLFVKIVIFAGFLKNLIFFTELFNGPTYNIARVLIARNEDGQK